jgi:hypothetical protein
VEHLSGPQIIGRLLALSANIRLGWEGLTDKLSSFLGTFVNHGRKKFNKIWPCTKYASLHNGKNRAKFELLLNKLNSETYVKLGTVSVLY